MPISIDLEEGLMPGLLFRAHTAIVGHFRPKGIALTVSWTQSSVDAKRFA